MPDDGLQFVFKKLCCFSKAVECVLVKATMFFGCETGFG